MKNIQHTPTPWEVKQDSLRHAQFYLMKRENGCTKRIDDKAGAFSESDAKQIVRAVNSHEAMLDLLRQIYAFTTQGMSLHGSAQISDDETTVNQMLKEAIAKAEGK